MASLSVDQDCLDSYSKDQTEDNNIICSKLIEYCTSGWPTRNELPRELRTIGDTTENSTLSDNLLL